MSPQERFAHRLRAAMQEKYGARAKAAQLARDTGLSEQTISRWLKAKVVPTPALLARLAPTLDVPIAEWLATAGILDEPDPASARYPAWGAWLRAALTAAALTARQLAALADIDDRTLDRWLTGASAPHSADVAIEIAHALGGDTVAAVAAAGHPKTAALLRERADAMENNPLILRIQADSGLTKRDKDRLVAEVRQHQRDEELIFERRVAEAVAARRRTPGRASEADRARDGGDRTAAG